MPAEPPLRVLVLAHEASRTGASLQLLHTLRAWSRDDVAPTVVLRRGGPLVEDFRAWPCIEIGLPKEELLWRALRQAGLRARRTADDAGGDTSAASRGMHWHLRQRAVWDRASLAVRRVVPRARPQVVLANTATHGDVIAAFRSLPVVTHAHERAQLLARITLPGTAETQLLSSRRVIAVSDAVADDVHETFRVPRDKTEVIRPFVPPGGERTVDASRDEVRGAVGCTPSTVLVGAVGTLAWEKDPAAFIDVAEQVRRLCPDSTVRFVWVGREAGEGDLARYRALADERGLSDLVHFDGEWRDPVPFYRALDLLLLTSRTDAFPLAVLEAAREGVPTVCFAAAGGAREFVRDDAGISVDDHDSAAMASAVAALVDDASLRRRLGAAARARVRSDHDVAVVASRILGVLRSVALDWTGAA